MSTVRHPGPVACRIDTSESSTLFATIARAASLRERWRAWPSSGLGTASADADVEELSARWRAHVEPPGTDWFDKRLRWDGLEARQALSALASPSPGAPLPDWADVLAEICHAARTTPTFASEPSPSDPDEPIPFEGLLIPALVVGRARLRGIVPDARDDWVPAPPQVSPSAYLGLERDLLRQLVEIAGESLEREFTAARPWGLALTLSIAEPRAEPDDDIHYRRFVARHLSSGWMLLLDKYPALGRLVAVAVSHWVEATAELFERLTADSTALMREFHLDTDGVDRFELGLSDRHRGGRSVVVLEFADGSRVVYKPKPMSTEAAFNRLVAWCNSRGVSPELHVTRVLARDDYGWVEYVEQRSCEDLAAAHRYFTRAGMLLCLLHILRATDCHYENLVAHGDQPVLVDCETLLHPDPQPLESQFVRSPQELGRDRALTASVTRTGLLPGWRTAAGRPYDNSGLGGVASAAEPRRRWRCVNTDSMRSADELRDGVHRNAARLSGQTLDPSEHEDSLVDGFESMYRLLAQHVGELSGDGGPLADLRSTPVRFVHRATRIYAGLIAASWSPEILHDGLTFGLHFEQLARAYLGGPEPPVSWPLLAAESRAVEQMDVPVFLALPSSRDLALDDGILVRDMFARPSYDVMVESLGDLSDRDLERQVLVIRGALRAKSATSVSVVPDRDTDTGLSRATLSSDELLDAAVQIGLAIEHSALSDGKDACNWTGYRYLPDVDRYQLDVLNDSLYDGCSGVAVFLAALSRVTGEARFADVALQAVRIPRDRLRAVEPGSRRLSARMRGLGAASGIGSVLYSFVKVGALLDDADLLSDAMALAEWFTPDLIAEDDRLDVLGGAAGAVLALLSLHAATGSSSALDAAAACGEHLLRLRVGRSGYRTWRTIADHPLTGFSHGAAGISYALARLHSATADPRLLAAAHEGIMFERSVFSPDRGAWPDLRDEQVRDPSGFPVKWCHGAGGIALARAGSIRECEVPGLREEVELALAATERRFLQDLDFVCCGNMGRVEAFLVGHQVIGVDHWRTLATSGAAGVVERAARLGGYRLFGVHGAGDNPGFFQGSAGVGYGILRLIEEELPSVLLFE